MIKDSKSYISKLMTALSCLSLSAVEDCIDSIRHASEDDKVVVSHDVIDTQIPMYLDERHSDVKQVTQDGAHGNGHATLYGTD